MGVETEPRSQDWDPFAPDAVVDPPSSWAGLRESCPVAWTNRMGGFWLVSRYEDVVALARGSDRFNNSGGPQFGTPRPPLEVDRPEHSFFRRILQPYFARERVEQLAPRVREFVVEMLDPIVEAGGGDLAEAIAYPLARAHPLPLARASGQRAGPPEGDRGGDSSTPRRAAATIPSRALAATRN